MIFLNFDYLNFHGLINDFIDVKVCYDRVNGDFVAVADYEEGEDRYDASRHVELPYRCHYEHAAKSAMKFMKNGSHSALGDVGSEADQLSFYEVRDIIVPFVLRKWECEHGLSVDWEKAALI